jgi:hypothetical protein
MFKFPYGVRLSLMMNQILDEEEVIALDEFAKLEERLAKNGKSKDSK